MSQTNQQGQGAGPSTPRVRKDWELFWRIIAGLMLVIMGWIVWVLYEITPRSVVTPLAYESKVKPIGRQPSATGAAGTMGSPQPTAATPAALTGTATIAVPQTSPEAAAAALAMEEAQAAARSGAHQAAADVQAVALEKRQEQLRLEEHLGREGLKLSTEITTPLAERKRITKNKPGNPGGAPAAPAATDAAGKARP
jgi:hypothetical protein